MADDAIVYRYIAPHVIASLVVPMSMVGIYQWDGWMVLVSRDDVREEVEKHERRRKNEILAVYLSDILKWRRG